MQRARDAFREPERTTDRLYGVKPLIETTRGKADAARKAEGAAGGCPWQIRAYRSVLLVINPIVGLAVWAACACAGLPDVGSWGLSAAALHVVPYLGMALLTALSAAETFLVHGTIGSPLVMASFLMLFSTLIGIVVTVWLQGCAAKISAAAVLIGVVFWGALWGIRGLLPKPALLGPKRSVAEHTRPGQRFADLIQG